MVIDELHKDHVNISRILDLLEQQLEVLRREESPDYYLMTKIVEYIQEYPEIVHHPREDAMFSVYLEGHDEGSERIDELMREHRELNEITTALRDTVETVFHGGVVNRESFQAQLADFIGRQRAHVNREEGEVFPLIEARLTAADWQRVESMIPDSGDPVFGPTLQSQYETLYRHIFPEPAGD